MATEPTQVIEGADEKLRVLYVSYVPQDLFDSVTAESLKLEVSKASYIRGVLAGLSPAERMKAFIEFKSMTAQA